MDKIDFVIPWVDENDPEWRKERKKWSSKLNASFKKDVDLSNVRFRDWGLLRYWFRGVEKFAPWVNMIHFITYGHLPDWLNEKHPKLHIVKHSDFIPKDNLPIFSCNPIELLLYRIDGLSECFVYYNDDTLLLRPVSKADFFRKGIPVNTMALHSVLPTFPTGMSGIVSNNVRLINKNFDYKVFIRENFPKLLSFKQGKYIVKTLPLLVYKDFPGFANFHMPNSFTKTTFQTVWAKEGDALTTTLSHKFRDYRNDYSQWLFNYWQFASGNFLQRSVRFGINTNVTNPKIISYIIHRKAKCINIGDSDKVTDFEETRSRILAAFEQILPEKSEFEK